MQCALPPNAPASPHMKSRPWEAVPIASKAYVCIKPELQLPWQGGSGRRGMEAAAELRRLREQAAAQQAALAAAEAAAREAQAGRGAAEEALRDLRLVRPLTVAC